MGILEYGVDSADPAPSVPALRAARLSFACRYLSPPGNSKNLTAAEAMRLHRGGISTVTVWESWATRASEGRAAAIADAKEAVALGKACGPPAGYPIHFAVDYDASGSVERLRPYYAGLISALGLERLGIYGGKAAIDLAYSMGIRRLWQTYAWSGSPTAWHPAATLRQYSNGHIVGGVPVALNYATAHDFGQWLYVAPPAQPTLTQRILRSLETTGHFGPKSAEQVLAAAERGGLKPNR